VDECKPLAQGGGGGDPREIRDGAGGGCAADGRAVQVDPMTPKLKPPGTKRLRLKCDIPLSTSAFKLNLRRYSMETERAKKEKANENLAAKKEKFESKKKLATERANDQMRQRKVGRCWLTLSNPI